MFWNDLATDVTAQMNTTQHTAMKAQHTAMQHTQHIALKAMAPKMTAQGRF
jgi:hypothetical protein